uniref:LIM zinc-binding domain-containing protein n=2 Tax=Steinernema glaseri TaxID=37863 RepID=A0A1I8ALX6_9BILA
MERDERSSVAAGPLVAKVQKCTMGSGATFDSFAQATTFRQIVQSFNQLCLAHGIDPTDYDTLYAKLHGVDSGSDSSKAQTFFSLIDKRFNHPIYLNQKVAKQLDVLIVGAGPCGLRAAIECRLLGAHVVVIEQRDKFTRNNVLHLWPFVTEDLKSLGVKIFYPKFCTGCIDHISIRQLQCVLLKVALCVGVQVYDSVSFVDYQKPTIRPDGTVGGWTALLEPPNHILSEYEFDILIGADGKRNTVKGFAKDCMRAQLAIGITANFKNMRTAAEILVPELSGVAYLYRQSFFNRMEEEIGVQLENIVYYKDDTHYFVMSAKKKSLLKKKVLKQDYDEISLLLAKDNIDQEMLCKFATETANFATENKLPLNFVTNTRGDCDVAMFDFTCMYKAQHSTRLYEHGGKFLLTTIVGDSLYEPFWPTGSGCARGFLGVFDSAWMIRELGLRERPTIEIIADRERVYSLLGKASKDNMKKALSLYTIDPTTRYSCIELVARSEKVKCHVDFQNAEALGDNDIWDPRNGQPYGLESANRDKLRLWRFCDGVLAPAFTLHRRVINFSAQSWGDGFPLAFLMGRFRGDLVNLKEHCTERDADKMVKAVLEAIEREYGLAAPCEGIEEWEQLDDGERYQYIKSLVTHLKRDQEHVRKAFSSTPRIANRKRVRVNTSNTYKSEQIQRATEMLKSQFTDNDSSNAKAVEKSLEAQREIIERTVDISPDVETKHFTKKPFVERLDPVKLCRVEQIISGQLEKDQSEQFHNTRFVTSAAKTRRLDRTDLEEMEQKLEKTGMGVLIDKDKIHSMSSKEEKMMRMSAADARSFALGGFKDDCEKFKDIDSRLEKADKQLKNTALSGVTIVSQIRGVPSTKKGPPPPTPPKSVRPNVPEVPMRANAPENAPRPVSMPATSDSLYSSINSRRRNPCALCSNEVYLAEQLLVEKKVVHKRCFRCCYCEQPLRLGNHGTDRAITEAYGIRFFCSQHMAMSYRDKVARIEKHTKRANRASVAIVQPLPPVPASLTPKTAATNTISNAQSKTITETPNEKQPVFGLHSINSPDAYKQRTIERIQAIAEQPKISASLTPERAEFQCVRPSSSRRKQPARELNEAFLLTSDDEEVDDTKWTKFRSRGESSQSSEIESSFSSCTESDTGLLLVGLISLRLISLEDVESVASDVEDHFTDCQEWLQDCLGDQLRDYFEEHPDEEVTMQNAEEVLNLYNKMIQGEALTEADCPNTPEGTEPLNGSIYYTTRSKFNSPKEESDEEKSSGSNGDLLDNTISGFGARFSLNHCPNDALSTSPSSRVYDTDAPATAEDTQTIDASAFTLVCQSHKIMRRKHD